MNLRKMGLLSVAVALAAALPSRGQMRGRYIVPGGRRPVPVWSAPALRPLGPGFHARVRVVAPTGFDWAFAVPVNHARRAAGRYRIAGNNDRGGPRAASTGQAPADS